MLKFNSDRIEGIFAGMKDARIAVVGDLMLDRYLWGEVDRMSPEAPVPIVHMRGESTSMGGAANVAANVGSLGAQVQLFGVIGKDAEGEHLRELINNNHFGDAGVVIDNSRPTIVKTRIIASGQHVVRIDREVTDELEQTVVRKLLVRFRAALGGMDAVILEDYNKGVLTPTFIQEIITSCRDAHVPVGVDPKQVNFWAYHGATLFKPNLRELQAALGRIIESDDELSEAGSEVMKRLKLNHLLITRGKQGMALFSDDEVHLLQTRAHRVHDVSGAGDTVIATIMTALAGGADILEAASLANRAASLVIAEVGAVPVDPQDLLRTCQAEA